MKFCKLKNGSTVPQPVVITSMISLKSLANSKDFNDILALYELGKKAQDPKHEIFSSKQAKVLKDLALMQHDDSLHDVVKDIAQSAISFEGEIPVLGNPVTEIF
jgi:hypothetical protein